MEMIRLFCFATIVSSQEEDSDDKGSCLLSHIHKPIPSPEPNLNGECRQWRSNSCCMANGYKQYSFKTSKTDYKTDHCGQLSDQCLIMMQRQWCLYQCDPYLEKWVINYTQPETSDYYPDPALNIVNAKDSDDDSAFDSIFNVSDYELLQEFRDSQRTKSHRLWKVPLCRNDCDAWWNACKAELTCTDDWYGGFSWEQNVDGKWRNLCKNSTDTCKRIDSWFSSSTAFCEGIFKNDYEVVGSKDLCISFLEPSHNYNASHGENSRNSEEVEITLAVLLGVIGICAIVFIGVLLWKKRLSFILTRSEITTNLLDENDSPEREVFTATAKLPPPSNSKSGRLNLPEYHPRHKNPIIYDNEVQEVFDANGKARKDRVDVVRNALEVFLQFNQNQSFSKLQQLRKRQKELPMKTYEEEICEAVAQSRVTIVAGDTGCGKSTQVPQYLLNHGFRKIAVTQPRRIASIALAKRVGYETLNMYGSHVGYKVRFDGTSTKATRIIFLTEGLLLRQMQMDTLLKEYDVIVLDEVHERHLQSDLLLGLLAEVIMKRDDLRLVLMSATINIELFSKYFEGPWSTVSDHSSIPAAG
ncbi:Oidioi.mRNA.OKI2018_I69.XSR.g15781.t1.cds [Oikopleura dioica]|uniref:Oidioi.mRNA.OKI2018_I69.XSR.g15781.t1.cds n=1 Tax=Oikopleura dioica TaxID=34765 RepID=A0ABN7SEG2_OIKDI|nr:Oidioi.mRNA.OKI2018_I69.XSR.g15781.t1.cds [Oikopleura dioica]